jgi:murein DD-endopeptidase MepM/ murein hydrolase activator NlpD
MKPKHSRTCLFIFSFILSVMFPCPEVCSDQVQLSSSSIVFPLLAPRLSSSYGSRHHPIKKVRKHHAGVDLAAPEKSHVRAVMNGTVIFAGYSAGYGNVVSIMHTENKLSLYGHLHEIHVDVGQRIEAGKIIGLVGSTGAATGPHLHFEWRENGEAIDPLKIFPHMAEQPLG